MKSIIFVLLSITTAFSATISSTYVDPTSSMDFTPSPTSACVPTTTSYPKPTVRYFNRGENVNFTIIYTSEGDHIFNIEGFLKRDKVKLVADDDQVLRVCI